MTKGIRLALCVPCYGDTKAKFTLSLSQALIHFMQCKLVDHEGNDLPREVEVFFVSCSMLTESRHRLVAEALAWEATHMLWLDADHVFPADTIPRLLQHGVDVVGANYARRVTPTAPTACKIQINDDGEDTKNLVYTTLEKASAGELEEVAHMGFGVCLIDMRVFDALQLKADESDGNFLPLFKFEETPGKFGMIGEDVYFFRKVRDAGCTVYIDHGLSWEVGHIAEQILTNAHANAHREGWEARSKAQGEKLRDKIAALEATEDALEA